MNVKEYITSLPHKVPTELVEGLETVFHFDIGGPESAQYTISLKDNKVSVDEGLHGSPECVVKGTEENLAKVLSGELNAVMAVMTGNIRAT